MKLNLRRNQRNSESQKGVAIKMNRIVPAKDIERSIGVGLRHLNGSDKNGIIYRFGEQSVEIYDPVGLFVKQKKKRPKPKRRSY